MKAFRIAALVPFVLYVGCQLSTESENSDPATVGETNSFEKPKSYAKGVDYVLVNGVVVIDKGAHTGATPGRAIRSPVAQPRPGGSTAAP